jgi:hypothetical protein
VNASQAPYQVPVRPARRPWLFAGLPRRPNSGAIGGYGQCGCLNLFASDHRVALYFDLSVRNGQRGDSDKGAAWEIVTKYLSANLREAIAVANIRNKCNWPG